MSSNYWIWKNIEERFQFFLLLSALCGCGYLTWYQLIYLFLMLFFGGVSAALVPFYNISQKKLNKIESCHDIDLEKNIRLLSRVESITEKYSQGRKTLPQELIAAKTRISRISNSSQRKYKSWKDWVEQERQKKGLKYGMPPDPHDHSCPPGYPIRVTENRGEKIYYEEWERGRDDYPSKTVAWCFENVRQAENSNYRPSKRRKKPK